jgi:hypothetical protein
MHTITIDEPEKEIAVDFCSPGEVVYGMDGYAYIVTKGDECSLAIRLNGNGERLYMGDFVTKPPPGTVITIVMGGEPVVEEEDPRQPVSHGDAIMDYLSVVGPPPWLPKP